MFMRGILLVIPVILLVGEVTSRDRLLAEAPLTICSFNIRIFGMNKMKKAQVVDTLIKIVSKYDIVTVQEIRDGSTKAFPAFVKLLNQRHKDKKFDFTVSKRLGRSHSKEQYGFIYRADRVKLVDTYQYKDGLGKLDFWEREPFAALFNVKYAGSAKIEIDEFSIISVHTKPTAAVTEVGNLTTVYDAVNKHWNNPDSIIAGDYNADCSYVSSADWPHISFWTEKRFYWAISKCLDTTTTYSDCSYDRFVLAGKKMQAAMVPNSAKVVHFDKELGLTKKETLAVSDHYPIEIQLSGKAIRGVQTYLDTYVSFSVNEAKHATNSALVDLSSFAPKARGFKIIETQTGSKPYEVVAKINRVKSIDKTIEIFSEAFPKVISNDMVRAVHSFAKAETFIQPPYVYGLKERTYKTFELEIRCKYSNLVCSATAFHQNN